MPATAVLTRNITPSPSAFDPLTPYVPTISKPWNARRVAHLYRRLGYGATLPQIQQGLQMTPSALVDQLLDTAAGLAPPAPPVWANWLYSEYNGDLNLILQHIRELRHRWLTDMLGEGIRAKMAFFWHNHFVTELDSHMCNSWLWSYYSLLHQRAFGNFRDFTREIGQGAAMLHYLNGNQNVVGEPNENYARELMELFTLGESNGYTQSDVVNMARSLTGWQADDDDCAPPFYNPNLHDAGNKTIFGQTSNFAFNSAHDLIFSARPEQVSRYVTGKIYKHFVYQNIDNQVIDGLAATFVANNWELLPVLKQLFKSEHFFEEQLMNAKLKNPLEAMIPLLKMADAKYPDHVTPDWWDSIGYWAYLLDFEIFNPPNVAGWKEHRAWINESTLTARWNYSAFTAYFLTQNDQVRENLRALAQTLTNDSNNPAVITEALIDFFTGQTLDPVHLQAAILNFKAGIPENYFLDGSWNLYWDEAPLQIVNLLYYLVKLPEYQLT